MNPSETVVTSSLTEEEIETIVEQIVSKMKSNEIEVSFTDGEQSDEVKSFEQKENVKDKPKRNKRSKQALSDVKAEILLKLNQPIMLSLKRFCKIDQKGS